MSETSESTVNTERPEAAAEEVDMQVNSEPTEEFPVHTPKKKKKKRDKTKEEPEEVVTSPPSCEVDSNTAPELSGTMSKANGNDTFEKKKKKKKVHPKVEEEEEELTASPVEVHNSDSSGYISDKSSKKRKHEMHTGDTSSEEPEPIKSKKKRKRAIQEFA